jgi:predicted RNase H-like HicB family nuclease
MDYIAYLHKERDSDFGVSFPDFPGCTTAGRTLDEARLAPAALAMHIEGMLQDGETIPEPSTLDALKNDPAREGAIYFLVPVSPMVDKPVRINVTARESQLHKIDELASKAGMTRSAFLVQSALGSIKRRKSA